MLLRQLLESLAPQRELSVAVRISQEAQHVLHRQPLPARPVALAAHAAIQRPDVFHLPRQDLLVVGIERRRHGAQVLLQLIHVRHAGNRSVHGGIAQRPFQRRQHAAVALQPFVVGIAGLQAPEAAGHHLHGHDTLARRAGFLDDVLHERLHREVVRGQNDIDQRMLRQKRQHLLLAAVRAYAREADLAGLLGCLLRLDQTVGDRRHGCLPVQIPDVHVVGAQFRQAPVQLLQRLLLIVASVLVESTTSLRLLPSAAPPYARCCRSGSCARYRNT